MSITSWFPLKSTKKISPQKPLPFPHKYFHFDGKSTTFTSDLPLNSIPLGSIKYNSSSITLSTTTKFNTLNNNSPPYPLTSTYNKSHLHILKSNLQKCTRRNLHSQAFQTAITLITLPDGLFELLRRFTIIMLEDCILSIHFPILLWFQLILTKKYTLNTHSINIILKIISNTLQSKLKDHQYNNPTNLITLDDITKSTLPQNHKNLLYAINLRTKFNGMPGDIELLHKSTSIWFTRFITNSTLINFLDLHYPDIPPSILKPEDILLESLDFHCTDTHLQLHQLLQSLGQPHDIQTLKTLIWDYSSSITTRTDISLLPSKNTPNPLWPTIEPLYKICCQNYFNKIEF